jgi:hypothetical protein
MPSSERWKSKEAFHHFAMALEASLAVTEVKASLFDGNQRSSEFTGDVIVVCV